MPKKTGVVRLVLEVFQCLSALGSQCEASLGEPCQSSWCINMNPSTVLNDPAFVRKVAQPARHNFPCRQKVLGNVSVGGDDLAVLRVAQKPIRNPVDQTEAVLR